MKKYIESIQYITCLFICLYDCAIIIMIIIIIIIMIILPVHRFTLEFVSCQLMNAVKTTDRKLSYDSSELFL